MLVLKGNVGKSVVLQSLMESYQDAYAIVYDKEMIDTLETLFVSSKHYGIDELCDGIKRDIDNDYLYVSTMHDIQESKIQRRLYSGRIKEFCIDIKENE